MNVDLRQRAEQLRDEVREFCAMQLPREIARKGRAWLALDKDEYLCWMRLLQARRWAVGHWPREHGGLGWSALESFVFEDELGRQGCPWVIPFGVKYVGPVLYTYGSEAQKARFLPGIIDSTQWWAQGYSEPGAGSDLAALTTRADRDGDHYVVNGQKCWTTYAQWADWMFCLVRTSRDARAQDGISFLLIDMKTPGVSVRPVPTMDQCHHVNEVWLDNVRVPVENRVGEEGRGWTLAKFLLVNERTSGFGVGWGTFALQRLKALAAQPGRATPALRQRIAELELRLLALEVGSYQALEDLAEGTQTGAEASQLKIRGTEVLQDIMEAMCDALGLAGIAYEPRTLHGEEPPPLGPADAPGILRYHLYNRASTIYGGTTEIQRNIVAKAVLGL